MDQSTFSLIHDGESIKNLYSVNVGSPMPDRKLSLGVIKDQAWDVQRLLRAHIGTKLNGISIWIAKKDRHLTVSKRHGALGNGDLVLLECFHRLHDIVDPECDVRDTWMLDGHIHQNIFSL